MSHLVGSPALRGIKALSLDVDGTLYPLGWRLWLRAVLRPGTPRVLRAVKRARERFREHAAPDGPSLVDGVAQELAAALGMTAEQARAVMHRADAVLLPGLVCGLVPPQTRAALQRWTAAGGVLAAFSDHATGTKLDALGLGQAGFSAVVSAEDLGAYKPHPRGFQAVVSALGLPPAAVVHVGDRADTDGLGALAAGLVAAVLAPAEPPPGAWGVPNVAAVVDACLSARGD